jgi:hypothetical protein
MNNQAAQTKPELPAPFDVIEQVDKYNFVHNVEVYTADQMHQYASDYAAALSQPAGAADGMIMVQKHDLEWIVAHVLDECDGSGPCADLAARRVRALLAAAPAASGGECNCASGRGAEHCVVHAHAAWDAPNTQADASVSERARSLLNAMLSAPYGDTTMGSIVCAETTRNRLESAWLPLIERALSSPRQEGEAVATVTYAGDRCVSLRWHTQWGSLPIGTKLYTHPSTAASTQGLREYITRIKEAHKHAATYSLTEYEKGWTRRGKVIADELESLLTSPTTGADGESLAGRGAE